VWVLVIVQMPFRPPPPVRVDVGVVSSLFEEHMGVLLTQQAHTDVVFVAGSVGFVAHRFLLAAASPALQRLLCSADPVCELAAARSSSETSLVNTQTIFLFYYKKLSDLFCQFVLI